MNRRRREAGFSFIEILVVMGIITVLVGMVVVLIPNITEKSRQTKSIDNLRSLATMIMGEGALNLSKLPPADGKAFTLWPVATGKISKKSPGGKDLEVFFSPGDNQYSLQAVGEKSYEGVTRDSLREGNQDFRAYTSYAGRRNKTPGHKLSSSELGRGAMILCDDDEGSLHHAGGLCIAYSNSRSAFVEWHELNISEPDDADHPEGLLGDSAENEDLKHLSSGN
jgi:type II secretory pathway pseudopilin PulG